MAKICILREKWRTLASKDEHEETRIISPFLFNKTKRTPVNTSILSNNLDYFRANYGKEYSDHKLLGLLPIVCLSGSNDIADFILEKLGQTYTSEGYDFILRYASASLNTDWVKEIARTMAKQGLKIPHCVFSPINSCEMMTNILSIFNPVYPPWNTMNTEIN